MKPALKAPGIKRLKLKHHDPLLSFAFKFNLRRFNQVGGALEGLRLTTAAPGNGDRWGGFTVAMHDCLCIRCVPLTLPCACA
jgi:hypothetical protein